MGSVPSGEPGAPVYSAWLANPSLAEVFLSRVPEGERGVAAQVCRAWREALGPRRRRTSASAGARSLAMVAWAGAGGGSLGALARGLAAGAGDREVAVACATLSRLPAGAEVLSAAAALARRMPAWRAAGWARAAAVGGCFPWACELALSAGAGLSPGTLCQALRHGCGVAGLDRWPAWGASPAAVWLLVGAACEGRDVRSASRLRLRAGEMTAERAQWLMSSAMQGARAAYHAHHVLHNTFEETMLWVLSQWSGWGLLLAAGTWLLAYARRCCTASELSWLAGAVSKSRGIKVETVR